MLDPNKVEIALGVLFGIPLLMLMLTIIIYPKLYCLDDKAWACLEQVGKQKCVDKGEYYAGGFKCEDNEEYFCSETVESKTAHIYKFERQEVLGCKNG